MLGDTASAGDYPDTHHGRSLSYAAVANRKHYLSVYLLGFYTDGPELSWFRQQCAERGIRPDLGKACVRLRRLEDIPLDLIGAAVGMIPVGEFIARHEASRGSNR